MFRVLAVGILMVGIAAGGFAFSLTQTRTLRMTRAYLAFCAVAGSVQLTLWYFWHGVYDSAYWIFEVAHNILLCFLSGEIIKSLLPRPFAWMRIVLAIPFIVLLFKLPLKLTAGLVSFSTSACFTGGMLLIPLFFLSVIWTKEHRAAALGIVALLVAELLSFLEIFHPGPNQVLAVQLAPLLGLLLLSSAGRPKQTSHSAHEKSTAAAMIPPMSGSARKSVSPQ